MPTSTGGVVDSAVNGPGTGSQRLVIAFALDGHTVVSPSGVPTVDFTSGGLGIWQAPTDFNKDDPTQWFNNFSQPLDVLSLATPTDIYVGNGDTLGGNSPGTLVFPSSQVNLSSSNAGDQTLLQGTILFNQTSDPGVSPAVYASLGGTQSQFLNVNSLLAVSNQTVGGQGAASDLLNADTSGGGTAAQKQAVVNNLASFFGLSTLTDGSISGSFATFGSGGASDYLPASGPVFGTNGDFSSTSEVELYPGSSVPEPSSLAFESAICTMALRDWSPRLRRRSADKDCRNGLPVE